MTTMALNFNWGNDGTSLKLDAMSLVLALALHVPLYYMKFESHKKIDNEPKNRLVAVDLIDPTVAAPPPPPAPVAKENNLMQRLKMLVKREPPPPPPPPKLEKAPEQTLSQAAQPIKIQANLKLPEPVQPKLATKSGFKTTADAKLVEEKQISLKALGTGIAPLSEKKLGTMTDRSALKSDKGNFKIARNDSLQSIGGGEAGISAGAAPAIAIRTGSSNSTEKFSAALPQSKSDKGRLGSVNAPGLGGDQKLGLRDQMIARDAAVGQIAVGSARGSSGGVAGGVVGGVEGGVLGGKKDAGRFQGGQVGGVIGGTGVGSVASSSVQRAIVTPAKPAQKKSMFSITGPLKDRKILSQVMPEYPAWAQAQGIEASVILEFTVLPDGSVKEDIVVRRTSGYPQLDQSAAKALRKWKFVPIADEENRSEIGQITFNYSLN